MHPSELTLTDYVDQAIGGETRADIDRHLGECAVCRALVDDLLAIRRTAASMPPIDPPAAAWTRIEQAIASDRLGQPAPRRLTWPPTRAQFAWLGLAATIILATMVGLRVGLPSTTISTETGDTAAATDAAGNPIETVESELRQAEEHYTKAISGLEQIANEGEGQLDPDTAATLQKSLAVVDQAIDESRAAVRSEPTNESAQTSLLDNFATKIALLQDTVALINEMRKGNDAGAAQIVSGLK
jgi:hypothetical protein